MTISQCISHQQVSCLWLLDLSAAFDTLDHHFLLHRLSNWLFISSLSLQLITSYLSSRTSSVAIPLHLSHSSPLTRGVTKGSVLGPILINLYITTLSSLISPSTISHHLHANDTKLSMSFILQNCSSAFSDLQSTVSLISSWMSSN